MNEEGGPYLLAALLCKDVVLDEQGGSLQHLVSGAYEVSVSHEPGQPMEPLPVSFALFIMLSAGLSGKFGRKNVALVCFSLAAVNAFAMYFLPPDATWGMVILAVTGSIVYAPTCAIMWAMYADAADYSEWQTGRRFTGMVFATIGFSLKAGLALGSAAFLWLMAGIWDYDTKFASATNALAGYRATSSLVVGLLFVGGAISIAACKLNKARTLQMAAELADRRAKATA